MPDKTVRVQGETPLVNLGCGDPREYCRAQAVEDADACGPNVDDLVVLPVVAVRRDGVGVRPLSQFLDKPLRSLAAGGNARQADDEPPAVAVRQALFEEPPLHVEPVAGGEAWGQGLVHL